MTTHVDIPTLSTARLTLRAPRMSDFDAYAEMVTSERGKYMQADLDRNGAWRWFLSDTAQWTLFGFGGLTIDISETGEPIGQVSITQGIHYPEPELGWLLYDGAEGKGFASEAAIALRHWAYEDFGLTTLVSYIDPENGASIRLAERLGAVRDDAAPRPSGATDDDPVIYRHPSPKVMQ